jgi:SM-20-related protein
LSREESARRTLSMLSDLFFRSVGFFVLPRFLTEEECARLRTQASGARTEQARVVCGADLVVDRDHRSTRRAELDAATQARLVVRMQETRQRVESHFRTTLKNLQPLQLLVYGPGDFFALHTDSKDRPDGPEFLRQRRVSVVVFLGHDGVPAGGDYGGLFQFHGLIDDPRLEQRAYPFSPQVGTLLAFPSHVLHEVTPVQKGVRYSLVTWFC